MAKTKSLTISNGVPIATGDAITRLRGALSDQEIIQFASFGIAATLPGMRYQWDQMGHNIRRLEMLLASQQAAAAPEFVPQADAVPRRGRPPKSAALTPTAKSGWPADPGERSKEMKRRMAVREANRKADHRHQAQSNGALTRWANMSDAKRKVWLKAMQEGKRRKVQMPAVSLERAS